MPPLSIRPLALGVSVDNVAHALVARPGHVHGHVLDGVEEAARFRQQVQQLIALQPVRFRSEECPVEAVGKRGQRLAVLAGNGEEEGVITVGRRAHDAVTQVANVGRLLVNLAKLLLGCEKEEKNVTKKLT